MLNNVDWQDWRKNVYVKMWVEGSERPTFLFAYNAVFILDDKMKVDLILGISSLRFFVDVFVWFFLGSFFFSFFQKEYFNRRIELRLYLFYRTLLNYHWMTLIFSHIVQLSIHFNFVFAYMILLLNIVLLLRLDNLIIT